MNTHLSTVIKSLEHRNEPYAFAHCGKGGHIIILPKYGRVLGLWVDDCADSLFWINQEFLSGNELTGWHNPGGDRMWMAPEREFFVSDLSRPWETSYCVPEVLDPGNYELTSESGAHVLTNRGSIHSYAQGVDVDFVLTRSIMPSDVGYTEQITLEVNEDSPMAVGYWNLIQVPQGGVAHTPLQAEADWKLFFGDTGEQVCKGPSGDLEVAFLPANSFKVGVKASDTKGSIDYHRKLDENTTSTVSVNFDVNPDALYVDAPMESPNDLGYVTQFFCGGGGYSFGELEHHSPAVGGPSHSAKYTSTVSVSASVSKLNGG